MLYIVYIFVFVKEIDVNIDQIAVVCLLCRYRWDEMRWNEMRQVLKKPLVIFCTVVRRDS